MARNLRVLSRLIAHVRACYAALRMHGSVNRYAEERRARRDGAGPRLNSGEVVVCAVGNDLHMDYTAVGETTHLAVRMEQLARPGTVLIAPATRHGRGLRAAKHAVGYVEIRLMPAASVVARSS